MIQSFLLSLIIFFLNGASVLKFYQTKNYLFKRAQAQFYLPSSLKIVFNYKEYFLIFFYFIFLFLSLIIDFSKRQWRIDFLFFVLILLLIWREELLKKINFTPKVILSLILVIIFNSFFLFKLDNSPLVFFSLSFWLSQFLVFSFVFTLVNFLSKPYVNFLGRKLKEKFKNRQFKIIGFAGSYGKSTTKEILAQLLSTKFKIISLPPHLNHEYAILKYLLKTEIEKSDFLLVEFGSYYLGNIAWLTKYLTPDISLITGITKQHLFLFGKIENILKGEGTEILSSMKDGLVFINNHHQYFEILYKEINNLKRNFKIYTYGQEADFSYQIIKTNFEESEFIFKTEKEKYQFSTNLIFPMQIENLTAALAFLSLIDEVENYKEKIKNINLPEGFLKLKRKDYLYIFDDSYNANPQGVLTSLNFFKKLPLNFKIIIFNGLYELGKETKKIYQQLAKEFSIFDKLILTSDDFLEIFQKELKEKVLLVKEKKEIKILLQALSSQEKVGLWIINRLPSRLQFSIDEGRIN